MGVRQMYERFTTGDGEGWSTHHHLLRRGRRNQEVRTPHVGDSPCARLFERNPHGDSLAAAVLTLGSVKGIQCGLPKKPCQVCDSGIDCLGALNFNELFL